jgi:hypothetical protein
MRSISHTIILTSALVIMPIVGLTEDFATVRGTVQTSTGAQVDLRVVLISRATNPTRTATIYPNGSYIIERVPMGNYDIGACDGTSYTPVMRTLKVDRPDIRGIDLMLRDPAGHSGEVRGMVQTPRGVITGIAIPIKLHDAQTGCLLASTSTDPKSGRYFFRALAVPEVYEIRSDAAKLLPVRVVLDSSKPAKDAVLSAELGSYQEVVEVAARNPDISVTDSSVTVQVTADSVTLLPLNNRNFTELATLTPGTPGNLSLTGDDAKADRTLEGQPHTPTSLSEQTARVARSIPVAGNDLQQLQLTRTGTNEFHGRANYVIGNEVFDAHNFFNLPGTRIFRHQGLSAEVGGPIEKERLFFFSRYVLSRRKEAPTFSKEVLSALPSINDFLSTLSLPPENLDSIVKESADGGVFRTDLNPSSAEQLFLQYGYAVGTRENDLPLQNGNTSSLPSAGRNLSMRISAVEGRYNRAFSSVTLGELSYRYDRMGTSIQPLHADEMAVFDPGLFAAGRSTDLEHGDGYSHTANEFSGQLKLTRGDHNVALISALRREEEGISFAAFQPGRLIVSNLGTLSINPAPQLFEIGTGGVRSSQAQNILTFSANDNIRLTTVSGVVLSLNYASQFSPMGLNAQSLWAPGLGIYHQFGAGGSTIVRANFFQQRTPLALYPFVVSRLFGAASEGVRTVLSFAGPNAAVALSQALAGQLVTGPKLGVTVASAIEAPTFYRGSLQLGHHFSDENSVELTYEYMRSIHLVGSNDINLSPLASLTSQFRPQPALAQLFALNSEAGSTSHKMTVESRVKSSFGMNLRGKYTFSKVVDDLPAPDFETTPEDNFNRRRERALDNFVPVHSFNEFGSWTHQSKTRSNNFLNLFTFPFVSQSLTFQSGRRLNVLSGFDANQDGNPLTDRPPSTGRNSFLGARFLQLDIGLGLQPHLSDQISMRFSITASNLLNHTNFRSYDTVLGENNTASFDPRIVFGRATFANYDFRHELAPGGFGTATSAYDPRRVEIGVELRF